ncbi:hypothetical protein [Bailinhaonella thermotolerans]|uniref:hypothetical protein n=1 Tax=Bailinhaonella thermotolerans TaxID=1070861 RepID=UPI00192A452B|nr:hypothetical protein [Bailinhaonella thermotolerans]
MDDYTLDMVEDQLKATNPQAIEAAGAEMRAAGKKIRDLITVLDTHLNALDKKWPDGADAEVARKQLRRIRETASSLVDTIDLPVEQAPAHVGAVPLGLSTTLSSYGALLRSAKGEVPENKDEPSVLEGVTSGALSGGLLGSRGGIHGAVIGSAIGATIGGFTSAFQGDKQREEENKKAREFLKSISEETIRVNGHLPTDLRIDLPGLTEQNPFDTGPSNLGPYGPGGDIPTGSASYDPPAPYEPRYPGSNPSGTLPPGSGDDLPGRDGAFPPGDGTANPPGGPGGTTPPGGGAGDGRTPGVPGYGDQVPGNGVNTPGNETLTGGSGSSAGRTELASYPPSVSGLPGAAGGTTGYPAGYGVPGGGLPGSGYGTAAYAAEQAAAARAAAGMGTPGYPFVPMGAGAGGHAEEETHTRTTELVEDESFWTSDKPATPSLITQPGQA